MKINIINSKLETMPLWNMMTDDEKREAIRLRMTEGWNVFCFDPKCKHEVDDHKVRGSLFSGNLHIATKDIKELKLKNEIVKQNANFGCPCCNNNLSSKNELYAHMLKSH